MSDIPEAAAVTAKGFLIPGAIVAAVLMQSAGALLWAGSTAARITELEREMLVKPALIERTAALEAQGAAIREQLARIETKIDALQTKD